MIVNNDLKYIFVTITRIKYFLEENKTIMAYKECDNLLEQVELMKKRL